jgi:hypothetical protein
MNRTDEIILFEIYTFKMYHKYNIKLNFNII